MPTTREYIYERDLTLKERNSRRKELQPQGWTVTSWGDNAHGWAIRAYRGDRPYSYYKDLRNLEGFQIPEILIDGPSSPAPSTQTCIRFTGVLMDVTSIKTARPTTPSNTLAKRWSAGRPSTPPRH